MTKHKQHIAAKRRARHAFDRTVASRHGLRRRRATGKASGPDRWGEEPSGWMSFKNGLRSFLRR